MAQSIVGVDIGASTLRGVEVADGGRSRPTVLRYAEVPLPEGSVSRGEVLEQNTVANAFRQLWSRGGFKSKDVVLGMGNQRVLARDLSVPRAPRQRIKESLPFVVQDMLPVPVQDALLDFYPIAESMGENGPQIDGMLIAAVKDAVLGNVNAVRLAGLNPVGVDLIAFALGRVLVHRAGVAGTVAVVDVGANTTSVVVLTDGVPQFVRIIPTGGDDITTALTARLEISCRAGRDRQAHARARGVGLDRRRAAGRGDRLRDRERAARQSAEHGELLREHPTHREAGEHHPDRRGRRHARLPGRARRVHPGPGHRRRSVLRSRRREVDRSRNPSVTRGRRSTSPSDSPSGGGQHEPQIVHQPYDRPRPEEGRRCARESRVREGGSRPEVGEGRCIAPCAEERGRPGRLRAARRPAAARGIRAEAQPPHGAPGLGCRRGAGRRRRRWHRSRNV